MNTATVEKVDTRWFQDRLADIRLSQRQLAVRMNLDPAAVSLMLRGRRKMSAAEAAEIARYLNVDVDEVLRHAGAAAHQRNAEVHGARASAAADDEREAREALYKHMTNFEPIAKGVDVAQWRKHVKSHKGEPDREMWQNLVMTDGFQDVLTDTIKTVISEHIKPDDLKGGKWGLLKANLGEVTATGAGVVADMLDMPVPLADGTVAHLRLPKKLTKADAQRIAALVTAFASPE